MTMFTACDESGDKAILNDNIPSNELMPLTASAFVLVKANADQVFQEFEYTAPDYGYKAAVKYTIQVAKAGTNFAVTADAVSSDTLISSIKVGQMNELALGLGLAPESSASIDFRVVSVIGSTLPKVYSNTVTVAITPYATVFPSIYGMGAALKGWGPWPDNAVEVVSSEYKKYEMIALLTNNQAFRFFQQLDWGPTSYNYPFFTTVDALFVNAADGDSNFKFVGTTGWYKVNVDMNTKTVTIAATPEPVLYMTGSGVNNWNWDPGVPVKLTYLKPGVWKVTHTFLNGAFRFFAQPDWGPTGYNYPYFTTVTSIFANANDGDKNFQVVTTG